MYKTLYAYPDGLTYISKPNDGDRWKVTHPHDPNGTIIYQYDDARQLWFDIANNFPSVSVNMPGQTPPPLTFAFQVPQGWDSYTLVAGEFMSTKCECGSDKAKQPRHSQWCKKFDANA